MGINNYLEQALSKPHLWLASGSRLTARESQESIPVVLTGMAGVLEYHDRYSYRIQIPRKRLVRGCETFSSMSRPPKNLANLFITLTPVTPSSLLRSWSG